jgi:hypothetical protein
VRTRAAVRICSLLTVCVGAGAASSGTIACTTTAVDFAGRDAGPSGVDAAVAPSDAPAVDTPAPDVLPPIPIYDAREAGPNNMFMGTPTAGPSRYVQYKCCLNNACYVALQGDDGTCRDASSWTLSATMDCENQGLTVAGIALYVGC